MRLEKATGTTHRISTWCPNGEERFSFPLLTPISKRSIKLEDLLFEKIISFVRSNIASMKTDELVETAVKLPFVSSGGNCGSEMEIALLKEGNEVRLYLFLKRSGEIDGNTTCGYNLICTEALDFNFERDLRDCIKRIIYDFSAALRFSAITKARLNETFRIARLQRIQLN
ncbi:MAG: hypothetical protein A3B68_03535 [Candidatus Melainabacteria bacterium RIFCSPHIGHO2_02_FULL_34_12]|nr:MAG: hypothetical protein A3B68_03535 [Candidatus Melainabacteria bacterium RIFCSPHIGHO2_02_FULL_34_12]